MSCIRVAAVVEDVVVVATGVLKCIGENRHAVKGAVVVNALRQQKHIRRAPCGVEVHRTEGGAEDVAEEIGLSMSFVDCTTRSDLGSGINPFHEYVRWEPGT